MQPSKPSKQKIFRQVFESLKNQIETGIFKTGDRLPSTRILSATLNISRHILRQSYNELASHGYIKLTKGLRPVVIERLSHSAQKLKSNLTAKPAQFSTSDFTKRVLSTNDFGSIVLENYAELNFGGSPISDLPIKFWQKVMRKVSHSSSTELGKYKYDPFGSILLRKCLVNYLSRSRGINTDYYNVVIFNNTECGTDFLCRVFVNPGDNIVVENPGTLSARTHFLTHGANLICLNIDRHNIYLDQLNVKNAKIIYLTPSHHDPLGTVMSLNDRLNLIKWAYDHNALIIEDDYDCEYHFTKPVQPSLKSLDEYGVVFYRYNFWRTLYPLTKLGFLVVPSQTVSLLQKVKSCVERDTTLIEQDALAHFISDGYFERHIKQTKSIYIKKRTAIFISLTKYFNNDLTVYDGGGIQIILTFSDKYEKAKILKAAQESNFPLISTADYYLNHPVANEFILFYTHFPMYLIEEKIKTFAEKLILI